MNLVLLRARLEKRIKRLIVWAMWTPDHIVVGCILPGERIHKEFDPEPDPLVYSVGLHKKPDVEVEGM